MNYSDRLTPTTASGAMKRKRAKERDKEAIRNTKPLTNYFKRNEQVGFITISKIHRFF